MTETRWTRGLVAALLAAALAGCAPAIRSVPTRLAPADAATAAELRFSAPLSVQFGNGYGRMIPPDSRWRLAGRLPEGAVYQPVDTVFSIEGQQVHEAWLVVRDGAIQGFYLAAEARYSALVPPVQLPKGTAT